MINDGLSVRLSFLTTRAWQSISETSLKKKQTKEVRKESERLLYDRNAELAQRLADLQNANLEIQNARRDALNLMEDAVQAREAMEALNTKLSESEELLWRIANGNAIPWVGRSC